MPNKMLIDATHPEETRVVVVRGSRVEEFDFESATKKQLRGNIYLAKVTRVEPSLQAAFVEYGGNRHGFLAFSEIHPDYYQIPVADRQALIEAEEREEREEAERRSRSRRERAPARAMAEASEPGASVSEASEEGSDNVGYNGGYTGDEGGDNGRYNGGYNGDSSGDHGDDFHGADAPRSGAATSEDDEDHVESVGAEDALEEVPERRKPRMRQYKIQEVIKRRQVLLVQVVKEERGTKGAALTTYLSLAGRYSVLMPNSGRGGGISRKITNVTDRKRLKEIAYDLEVPEGMGVILRTAGASRTKAEIKRDFEYLLRLWENVRELTLRSAAPTLVYEEGSLVKRSIRDLYNKDIDEVLVSGEESYREAKDFMRMLMPSHAKNVQPYRDLVPIFARFGVEPQLDAMFSPQVTLRSGGYIVINQTEALVSIDVNSGRSTREHNIEDTALATNMEAAEEVARQLRLRDLAGLIVIDFIDMEESKNNKSVERKLKECLKNDRARIQVGRISHFGLMEMSRQRIRTGVLEGSTEVCPHCLGAGIVRSTESVALHVLRALEDQLLKGVTHHLTVRTRTAVALYILNQKRRHLADLEARFGLNVSIAADEHLGNQHFALERGEIILNPLPPPPPTTLTPESVQPYDDEDLDIVEETDDEAEEETVEAREERPRADRGAERTEDDQGGRRKRRRRRRRRPGGPEGTGDDAVAARADGESDEDEGDEEQEIGAAEDTEAAVTTAEGETAEGGDDAAGDGKRRSRRRGRRGGRRRNGTGAEGEAADGVMSAAEGEAILTETVDAALGEDDRTEPTAAESGYGSPETGHSAPEGGYAAAAGGEDSGTDLHAILPSAAEVLESASEDADDETSEEPAYQAADEAPAERSEPLSVAERMSQVPAASPVEEAVEAVSDQDADGDMPVTETDSSPNGTNGHEPVEPAAAAEPAPAPVRRPMPEPEDDRPKRSGWWQRRSFF
ncbi:Rne/Rng family ribonuclease [Mongoliimonas terrestris]|uniref:Rne/Rng family ribonuclease n=1 Tax=Mongoliimonas terrestris TaxID=1709001 RepID=UPI00094987C8|nr:Rne/Rng family ribonuclease [Mongoliimonas terrestris]